MEEQKKPLREKTWFIILMLIVFFPAGLVLMWLYTDWGRRTKLIIMGVLTFILIIAGLNMEKDADDVSEVIIDNDVEANEEAVKPESPTDEEIAEQEKNERLEREKAEQEAEEQRLSEERAAKEEEEKAEVARAEKEKSEKKADAKKKKEKALAEKEAEEEPPYELIDGVAVFTDSSEIIFSIDTKLESFSMDMTDLLKEYHDEIENGAIFRSADTLTDSYGNEEKRYTLAVYYSQDTIDKINYDNWPRLIGSGLYDTADGVIVHPALLDNTVMDSKSTGIAPDIYYSIVGGLYTE